MIPKRDYWAQDNGTRPMGRKIAIKENLQLVYPEGNFNYVDLCCGTGDVLEYLADAFPSASFTGVDTYNYKEDIRKLSKEACWAVKPNLKFILEFMQEFIDKSPRFNVCSLLNSYRFFPVEDMSMVDQAIQLEGRKQLHSWLISKVDYFIASLSASHNDSYLPFKYKIIGFDKEEKYPLILCNTKELK